MVRRRPIQSKMLSSSKRISRQQSRRKTTVSSSSLPLVQAMPGENLDDETKLTKRHLTKEMWQLVSIAVKRMANELSSMSNCHQTNLRSTPIESSKSQQLTCTETINPLTTTIIDTGAGEMVSSEEKQMIPIEMFESSVLTKQKVKSNNATHSIRKSKVRKRLVSNKKNKRIVQHIRESHRSKSK